MSFVSQLECVGGLSRWAVYAALHIPDAEERRKVGAGGGQHARVAGTDQQRGHAMWAAVQLPIFDI